MNEIKNNLNIKCNAKHCTLEYLIKKEDPAQDMSRAGILKRSVLAAEAIDDWMSSATLLTELELIEDAPQFSSFQAEYDSETSEKLDVIKKKMQISLIEGGVITRVLQAQYMLQLLLVNYLKSIRETKLSLKAKQITDDKNVGLPEMSALFTDMMLNARNCPELEEIRDILIKWGKKNENV